MRPIVNVPEEDRATDMGNIHKKLGKDRACGSVDILSDRQTDTHTQTYSLQYFAAPAGEVISHTCIYSIVAQCQHVEGFIRR